MKVELTKFRVKNGKSKRVDEWIKYMHHNMDDILLNLEGEKMYVETIFREKFNDVEYLYWYSVQDPDYSDDVNDVFIDRKHLEYMEECIDFRFRPEDMDAEVMMVPNRVREVMR